MATYDVQLGRIRLPTVLANLTESLGDGLEVVGAQALAGEPRARPFALKVPVHAAPDDTGDAQLVGDRLRRQVRSLLENAPARLGGLTFRFAADPELDAVLLVGGGDLSYSDDGGVTFGDYLLELTDVYKVGGPRTHRRALRLEVADRRLSTTPRDILRTVYSTDFAAQPMLPLHFLPTGAADLVVNRRPAGFGASAVVRGGFIDGNGEPVVPSAPDASVVSFEQAPVYAGVHDVVVYDQRGNATTAFTPAGDLDPQASYGWEEVYGPDHPLTAGTVPTMQNGKCRVRWENSRHALILEAANAATGLYVEQGRITFWRCDTAIANVFQYGSAAFDGVVANPPDVTVVEWTPERVVVKFTLASNANRCTVYLSLQRGWTGPRVEAYADWDPIAGGTSAPPGVSLRYTPRIDVVNAVTIARSNFAMASDKDPWDLQDIGDFSVAEPWVMVQGSEGTRKTAVLSVLQSAARLVGRYDTAAYGGVGVAAAGIDCRAGTSAAGYCSVTFGITGRAAVIEAETYRAGSTTSQVADAAAGSGQAVEETQTAELGNTVIVNAATLDALGALSGRYVVWVRARVVNSGAQMAISGGFPEGAGTASGVAGLGSTGYAWTKLGENVRDGGYLYLNAWRTAGTGAIRVDRIVLVPVERRGGDFTGVRDHAQANLADCRQLQSLAAR